MRTTLPLVAKATGGWKERFMAGSKECSITNSAFHFGFTNIRKHECMKLVQKGMRMHALGNPKKYDGKDLG